MVPRSRSIAMTRPISLIIEGWIPSVGSSSTNKRGRMTSARAMASCCCCPPDKSPPRRRSIVPSTGNRSKISAGTVRPPRGRTANPVSRFSRTVKRGKMSRPCGTQAIPRRARSNIRSRVMSAPSHRIVPPVTGWAPVMARIRLVLPTPFRPSTAVTAPGSAEIDTSRSARAAPYCRLTWSTLNMDRPPAIRKGYLQFPYRCAIPVPVRRDGSGRSRQHPRASPPVRYRG